MAKPRKSSRPKRDIHAEITANIIAAIEADPASPTIPWRRTGGDLFLPRNAHSQANYNGINILNLWVTAEIRGYQLPIWGTYKQWAELDCQVRKGETSTPVIFYKQLEVEPDPNDANDDGKRHMARASNVFNAEQVDGFEPPAPPVQLGPIERIYAVDNFTAATKADIRHGGQKAYYRPSQDYIQMPDEGLFTGTGTMDRNESYYAVLLHELTHWTGNKRRLDRNMKNRFGDDEYAAEELVAELASAFLCAELQITQDTREDHAKYLAHWIKIMKGDSKAIFAAAAKASQAVAYLKSLQQAPS